MLLDNAMNYPSLVQFLSAADSFLGGIAYHALWSHQSTRITEYRHELLSMMPCSKFFELVPRVPLFLVEWKKHRIHVTYVFDPKIADTTSLYVSVLNGVFDCPPTLQPLHFSSMRAVQ